MTIPYREIRAVYGDKTIRVYQAYPDAIADSALANGTFVSPPFSMDRMTWIKPSFLWMMYRSGWGAKDPGQARILAIDITRAGFEWALGHSCFSHFDEDQYATEREWQKAKARSPVRIQWDPERDLSLRRLGHRSIQIGLSKESVAFYVHEWIQKITDITDRVKAIHTLTNEGRLDDATRLVPMERPYPVSDALKRRLSMQ